MSTSNVLESNKAVTCRFTEEFKNRHNFEVIDELFSPKAVLHLPAEGLPDGPDGQKTIGRVIFAAFSGCSRSARLRHRGRQLCSRAPYRSRDAQGRIHGHSRHREEHLLDGKPRLSDREWEDQRAMVGMELPETHGPNRAAK
jgi:hypothetical protein